MGCTTPDERRKCRQLERGDEIINQRILRFECASSEEQIRAQTHTKRQTELCGAESESATLSQSATFADKREKESTNCSV